MFAKSSIHNFEERFGVNLPFGNHFTHFFFCYAICLCQFTSNTETSVGQLLNSNRLYPTSTSDSSKDSSNFCEISISHSRNTRNASKCRFHFFAGLNSRSTKLSRCFRRLIQPICSARNSIVCIVHDLVNIHTKTFKLKSSIFNVLRSISTSGYNN